MNSELEVAGRKMVIERLPDGRVRTSRMGISDADLRKVVLPRRNLDMIDLIYDLAQAFAGHCGMPIEQIELVQFFDQLHREFTFYLRTKDPIPTLEVVEHPEIKPIILRNAIAIDTNPPIDV